MQVTCTTCYTYDVPTESKLPVPVDLDFYAFAGYSIYRCSMMTVVQILVVSIFWGLIFDFLKCVLRHSLYVFNNLIFLLISTRKSVIYALLYTSATLNEYFQVVVFG